MIGLDDAVLAKSWWSLTYHIVTKRHYGIAALVPFIPEYHPLSRKFFDFEGFDWYFGSVTSIVKTVGFISKCTS